MAALVMAQLLVLAVFNLWPVTENVEVYQDITVTDENVALEDIQVTTQQSSPPPPPRPQVPRPVPNDEVIEEEIVFEDYNPSDFADSLPVQDVGQVGNRDGITGNPDVSPSVVRIVEFNTPEEAVKAGLRARIFINFLVDREGNVEEAYIDHVEVYDREIDRFVEVDRLDYGITEKVLEAAMRWKFRPARKNGEPVKSYAIHSFTISS